MVPRHPAGRLAIALWWIIFSSVGEVIHHYSELLNSSNWILLPTAVACMCSAPLWAIAQHSTASEVAGMCAEHTHSHKQATAPLTALPSRMRAKPHLDYSSYLRGDEVALCRCLIGCGFMSKYLVVRIYCSSWLSFLWMPLLGLAIFKSSAHDNRSLVSQLLF